MYGLGFDFYDTQTRDEGLFKFFSTRFFYLCVNDSSARVRHKLYIGNPINLSMVILCQFFGNEVVNPFSC